MKSGYWLGIVAAAFVAGWVAGRKGGDDEGKATTTAPARESATPRRRAERTKSIAQWAEGMRDRERDELKDFARTIPAAELGPAIEKWIASHGVGGLGWESKAKLVTMMGDWAERDFDGARRWAEGVGDPVIREMALVSLAGALAKEDPQRAFECLVANGEFHQDTMSYGNIHELMEKLSAGAIAEGPEAFLALWSRLPVVKGSVGTTYGFNIVLGDDADFAAYADAIRQIRELGRQPISPGGVIREWAKRDVEAATEYVLETGMNGGIQNEWWDLRHTLEEERGKREMQEWTVEMLRRVPEDRRVEFVKNSGMQGSPERVLGGVDGTDGEFFQPGEREGLARDMLQAVADQGWGEWDKILVLLEPEQQLEALSQVRGVGSNAAGLRSYLEGKGYAAGRIEEVMAAAVRPKD